MCVSVCVCSSSSSTRLFPNDFTTKAWSPLLDGDPLLPGVFITSLLHSHPCVGQHTHIYTHVRTHATLSGARTAARKSGGTNYSSLLFLSLPRQPHKTALQTLDKTPLELQVDMPTRTSLDLCVEVCACVELLGQWVTRPGPVQW